MVADVAVWALLALAVGAVWLGVAGVAIMPTPLDRLHYVAPVSTLAPLAVGLAAAVQAGFTVGAVKPLVIALAAVVTAPVVTHAIGRALAKAR